MKPLVKILLAVLITTFAIELHAQAISAEKGLLKKNGQITFSFPSKSSTIEKSYGTNEKGIDQLDVLFQSQNVEQIASINIRSFSFFESSPKKNRQIAQERVAAIQRYLQDNYSTSIQDIPIYTSTSVNNWKAFERVVKKARNLPKKAEILKIIKSSKSSQQKMKSIKQLDGGRIYRKHIRTKLFAQLCTGSISYKLRSIGENITLLSSTVISEGPKEKKIPTFKTNLLFLAATALNLEFEVPMGNRASLALEGIFPFWQSDKHQFAMQIYSGTGELRYWLGNRSRRPAMTGWFMGLYGGYGQYDIEWKQNGIQSTFFHTGLGLGYTHQTSERMHIEYSVGLGYMKNKYTTYEAVLVDDQWKLAILEEGAHTWIGPTRAKISLIWKLGR
ncbi:MAG: DUF3575 domain-containing protein [Bacteroidales bacterium]